MDLGEIGEFCSAGFILTSMSASAGYTLGTLSGKNPLSAAKIAAISALTVYIFRASVEYGTDLPYWGKNILYTFATTLGGAALISALKNYEMISTIGIAILGTSLFVVNTIAFVGATQGFHLYSR